jgi:hypothetical protein
MMERKKKLKIIQLSLLIIGILIVFLTYSNKDQDSEIKIIPEETQEKIKKRMTNQSQDGDVFYNIEYSGLDLAGNRYILKSKEAFNDSNNKVLVNMKIVKAVFYFKDDKILNITSDEGIYNNKTLDMNFYVNVRATYEGSELLADKAEYSNSKSFLKITENVKVTDMRGTIVADRLLFDIKKQTLDIASFDGNKINANVNVK